MNRKIDSSLVRFVEEAKRFPMLSPEREQELTRAWRDHEDRDALRQLVGSHLRLVVKIARAPNTQLFDGQLDLDRSGAVVVDRELRTSRPGVFAVGDVVSGAYPRVAAALGQGSVAARSVLHYLDGRS